MRSALGEIRRVQRDLEAELSEEDRMDLAAALHMLAIAQVLEADLKPLDG